MQCTVCSTDTASKWYYKSEPEKVRCRPCFNKGYLKDNRPRMYSLKKAWLTPERKAKHEKQFRINHPEKYKQAQRRREAFHRAKLLRATPPWLTESQLTEIRQIYDSCPKKYHVDHIVPLKGVTVSGLHVPWNLQHLPAQVNIKKSNKLT